MNAIVRWMAAALFLLLWSAPAAADSWAPPQVTTYHSANKKFRLIVHPRPFTDALDFFTDKVCEREPAGTPAGSSRTTARAVMEKGIAGGGWQEVWAGPLVNEVAPVDVLVSDDGRHVVTFDNWHMMGHGNDVVAIYGEQGRPVRSLGLTDFLPASYVRALPRTISSIHWRGENGFSPDGARLILAVVVPSKRDFGKHETIDIEIGLADGSPVPPAGPRWDQALAAAAKVDAADRAAEEKANAAFIAPLLGPKSSDERAWHDYLREAFYRTVPDWREDSTSTTVLRPRAARDYAASAAWVRESLGKVEYDGENRALASPDQENLAAVFAQAARKVRAGELKGVRFYIAVGDALIGRFKAALDHTGAELVQFDPTEPIPQRPERIARRNGTAPPAVDEMCGPPAA